MKPLEEMVQTATTAKAERKIIRPQKEQALNCPRCNSTNTKFCYYNNYSLSQPRYFCKTCRRYWTEGGSLRNIPVGGGSRRNKRSSSSSSSNTNNSSSAITTVSNNSDHHHLLIQNPKFSEVQDLNLGFPPSSSSSVATNTTTHHQDFKTISELIQVPNFDNSSNGNTLSCSNSSSISAAMGLNSFLTMPIGGTGFSSGGLMIPMPPPHDFKPTLNFSLDGLGIIGGSGNGGGGHVQETTTGGGSGVGRLLFPFEDLKQQPSSNDADHHQQQNNRDHNAAAGNYWNGVLGGNGSW